MRLQRFLALAGIASRRKSEDLIAAGVVAVDDEVVTRPGREVDPDTEVVTVRGRRIGLADPVSPGRYLLLHKPAGVVTTRADPGGRETVFDYVTPPPGERLLYVGRLDVDTEGVLLFTHDGELAHRLTHPAWGVPRRYRAVASKSLDLEMLRRSAETGLMLNDGRSAPYGVLGARETENEIVVDLELREGKKREVRRMIAACGGSVRQLVRTHFAFLTLDGVAEGAHRSLRQDEVERLYGLVKLSPCSPERAR